MPRKTCDAGIDLIKQWITPADEHECWNYSGKDFVKNGNGHLKYGRVRLDGKRVRAHRAAWLVCNGEIPEGSYVCHRCDNPLCCNPAHLFIGDAQSNVDDKIAKGRARYARGEHSGTAKLLDIQVSEIRRRATSGENQRLLAAEFGVSQPLISAIKHGKTRLCAA